MIRRRGEQILLLVAIGLAAACGNRALAADAPVDYVRDIKPLFSDRCYACHGPDAGQRKADLRLDRREAAVDDSGVIVPGKAQQSELLARITSEDADLQMPPARAKKPPLSPDEVALVKRWIDQGAPFDAHWAYVAPKKPELPQIKQSDWVRTPVDHFILARLEQAGLAPAAEADRRTLVRRLSFDLTGLPPTPQQVAEFEADTSPDAYERLVDRLLDSPHYGERMAMYWLDLVRYADTNGIHGDNHRPHSLYRDYVIAAFNDNKPFDRFTIEQLSGDLLPDATRQQRIASGYNRLNMTTREGGAQPKEYMAKYAADRVRNVSSVWLGSTMGCSECHDHKFDPFTMNDFYSLASFFADVQETPVGRQAPTNLPTEQQNAELQELDRQLAEVNQTLGTTTPEIAAAQSKWEAEVRQRREQWTVVRPENVTSDGNVELTIDGDVVLAAGNNADQATYTVTIKPNQPRVTAVRLEVLPDDKLPAQGPGRAGNGNFVLTGITAQAPDVLGDLQPISIAKATATHQQQGFPIAAALEPGGENGQGRPTGWAILPQTGQAHAAVFQFKQPLSLDGETSLVLSLEQFHGARHTIGRFRLSVSAAENPAAALTGLPAQIASVLRVDPGKRDGKQKQSLADYYRRIAPALADARKQLQQLQAQRKKLAESFPELLVTVSTKPRMMRILPRGNWLDDSGPVVEPNVPQFLPSLAPSAGRASRLDLARWIVDPANPLTARVMVNRFWKLAFGRGIVASMDDFGSQGRLPSHPQLLDWLATQFVESGWDVRRTVKLLVMSSTYRCASLAGPELRKADPQNKLFGRQNRYRLDAEMVRDNALAVSGLLVPEVGGQSVKPYQPAGYWSHLNFPKRTYQHDAGSAQYRRGLYTYWCRTFLHPSLLAFDAPTREECCVERPRSNTPLQALVLLNDPTYVEAARALAERTIAGGGRSPDQRIGWLIHRVLQRQPQAGESRILADVYHSARERFEADPAAAEKLLGVGLQPRAKQLGAVELAAWTTVSRVVLNLHETITRE